MSVQSKISLPTVLCVAMLAGCGTQMSLKSPTSFTPKQVRLYSWEDKCKLQSYFDSKPKSNTMLMEAGYALATRSGKAQEVGSTTYRIGDPQQRKMFKQLLGRYYRSVPNIAQTPSFTVTVSYYRYCGRARMIIGSTVRLDAGGRTAMLDYHPCVGEYLLNGDLYRTRRTHVDTVVASTSVGRP
jgi:hypothetical protein